MSERVMLPDGYGLAPEAVALVAKYGHTVHLRLRADDDERVHVRTACGGGLGEWWSGLVAETTCPDCLALAPLTDHAAAPTSERGA